MNLDWRNEGNCSDSGDPDVMFPTRLVQEKDVAPICRRCPVRDRCLAHALNHRERYGVWGGMTSRQRAKLLKSSPDVTDWAQVLL